MSVAPDGANTAAVSRCARGVADGHAARLPSPHLNALRSPTLVEYSPQGLPAGLRHLSLAGVVVADSGRLELGKTRLHKFGEKFSAENLVASLGVISAVTVTTWCFSNVCIVVGVMIWCELSCDN